MRIKEGMIVRSEQGHDQGSFYVAVKIDGEFAYIADGRRRKAEKPKRKNPRHLNPTRKILNQNEYATNSKIRRILRSYNNECVAELDKEEY